MKIPLIIAAACITLLLAGCEEDPEAPPSVESISVPDAPEGPDVAMVEVKTEFSTRGSRSNLGHEIEYQFDWGDGNFSSWVVSSAAHACIPVLGYICERPRPCEVKARENTTYAQEPIGNSRRISLVDLF